MEKADILEMTVKYLRSLNTDRPLHHKQQQGKISTINSLHALRDSISCV